MKKIKLPFLILFALILTTSSCRYLRELSTLGKCEFRMTSVENYRLAGIKLDEIQSYGDLNILQIGLLTRYMAMGDLPLSFIVNVEIKNPNPSTAGLNTLEYIALIDDIEIARGEVNEKVEIQASGGTAIVPVTVTTNLLDAFKKESIQALFNLVMNLSDNGTTATGVHLKIKPGIQVGQKDVIYPGYINVKTEFSSGEN